MHKYILTLDLNKTFFQKVDVVVGGPMRRVNFQTYEFSKCKLLYNQIPHTVANFRSVKITISANSAQVSACVSKFLDTTTLESFQKGFNNLRVH